MKTNRDIADYYNQTINHYQNWWKLDSNLAVHYGIWDNTTKGFQEALANTNKVLMQIAEISDGQHILDAGCGVGGSAFYLATTKKVIVKGITLSEKQNSFANRKCKKLGLDDRINFSIQDYTNTNFNDNSFDIIWAIESITSASSKVVFAKEAKRILKPGGRLIIADYFKTNKAKTDNSGLLEKWRELWSMAPFLTIKEYTSIFNKNGFSCNKEFDFTNEITPTAKRMYCGHFF